jgi:hypothetical protein
MEYNVDYFINFFKAIPEDKWCINFFEDEYGRRCANGHLGAGRSILYSILKATEGTAAIAALFRPLHVTCNGRSPIVDSRTDYSDKLAEINNGNSAEYQQPTPKQRVLAALRDVKALQLKEADKLIEKSLMAAEPNLQLVTTQ